MAFLGRGQLALPDSQDVPPGFSQSAGDQPIARDVPLELRQPKFGPTLRRVAEFATSVPMPEAAIYKHRDPLRGKNEVWLAKQLCIPSPAFDLTPTKQRNRSQFGIFV